MATSGADVRTLPDYLRPGLLVVFVGINPGLYSARQGHYFARPGNRFWPAFSRSRLSAAARAALGATALGPEHDGALLRVGIGFTDIVKRSTRNAAELTPEEFRRAAPALRARLARIRPRVVCFHGLTAYRPFVHVALGRPDARPALGPQPERLGRTHLYVVPNPSPANAHFTIGEQAGWYDRLADFLDALAHPPGRAGGAARRGPKLQESRGRVIR